MSAKKRSPDNSSAPGPARKKVRGDSHVDAAVTSDKSKKGVKKALARNSSKHAKSKVKTRTLETSAKSEARASKNAAGNSGKKTHSVSALVTQVVAIWEDLRPRDASKEKKHELTGKIVGVAKGKLKELSVKSKASRVIQAVLKHGTEQHRQAVWDECKGHIVELSMSVYGNHVVRKFISFRKRDQLLEILRACKGNVVKLFRHPCGSPVLADLYEELPAAERNAMVAEFYSREIALLGPKASTATLGSLVQAWPEMDGSARRSTMQRLTLALQPILEKAYVDPLAIHRLVSEYMQLAASDMVQDCVESLSGEAVLRMVHTHEGCRAACMVAAYSTAKQRKKVVKAMKGHVLRICHDEFAYIMMIKVLSVVDDTDLVRKSIIAELLGNLQEVMQNQHGIKVLLSLVSPASKHLPPHAIEMLSPVERTVVSKRAVQEPGEEGKSGEEPDVEESTVLGISKKEPDRRRRELVGSGKGSLGCAMLAYCTENATQMLQTAHGGELVACLACASDISQMLWETDKNAVILLHEAISTAAGGSESEQPRAGPEAQSLLEHFFASRALKRMATAGNDEASLSFARHLWNEAIKHSVKVHVKTHAAKIIAALAGHHLHVDLSKEVCAQLKPVVGDVDAWIAKFYGTQNKR